MNFLFPDHRALCMAENATHNLHNLLTLRGALVRDPRVWSRYLTRRSSCSPTAPTSRSPRTTGRPGAPTNVVRFLPSSATCTPTCTTRRCGCSTRARPARRSPRTSSCRRRWTRPGTPAATTARSATTSRPSTSATWAGSTGNPSSLWQHPPQAAAVRYVEAIGGVEDGHRQGPGVRRQRATCGSPPSCSSTPCSPTPDDAAAKAALADVYERLGYGAENATWRAFYLTGAQELREGIAPPELNLGAGHGRGAHRRAALRLPRHPRRRSPRRATTHLVIEWRFTDSGTTLRTALSNGALIQTDNPRTSVDADLTVTLTKPQLLGLLAGSGLDGIEHTGDPGVWPGCSGCWTPPTRLPDRHPVTGPGVRSPGCGRTGTAPTGTRLP